MMKSILLIFSLLVSFTFVYSQQRKPKPIVKDSLSSDAFLKMVEESLNSFYADYAGQSNFNSIIDALEKETTSFEELSDAQICEHLQKMSGMSPFKFDCHEGNISTIKFFAKSRRSFIKIALGRSSIYFDMYEEALARHDMPLELKYLSVIESGLRPQVKSPAGALGLWQFMYGTGKMYGLNENSYIDERMDPVKSTDAACRYLKKLYSIYNDWNLALAAYNAGPGNINKAIRRSGGKLTYWEVRPFLPRETQGYVPNFVAAAYLMTYHKEYNLTPAPPKIHYSQLDTMCLKKGVHMQSISKLLDWDVEDIHHLNPIYKTKYIPFTSPSQCIVGPLAKIGKLVSLEDSLYKIEHADFGTGQRNAIVSNSVVSDESSSDSESSSSKTTYHKVRSGETLTTIAKKYGVTTKELMQWNKLSSTRVPVGRTLKIIKTMVESVAVDTNAPTVKTTQEYDTTVIISHTVERNESISVIAAKYSVSVEDIKKWNELSSTWLNVGQKLSIETKVKLTREVETKGTSTQQKAAEKTVEKKEDKTPVNQTTNTKAQFYTVKSGDLFNKIAIKHNLSLAELKKLNPSVNPDRISVGQKIRVK
jgi:membrane-bound lytic murein transglycosylase D